MDEGSLVAHLVAIVGRGKHCFHSHVTDAKTDAHAHTYSIDKPVQYLHIYIHTHTHVMYIYICIYTYSYIYRGMKSFFQESDFIRSSDFIGVANLCMKLNRDSSLWKVSALSRRSVASSFVACRHWLR